jgi:adenine phosphoribosyltransferase
MNLAEYIRDVPDFPKEGIVFKDITTLLKDPSAFKAVIDRLEEEYSGKGIDVVVGVESRGFIFGAPLAVALGAGFVPVRKPGKLPAATYQQSYELEYGTDSVEIHKDAIAPGQKVLVVDDLLATGGTVAATVELLKNFECEIVAIAFLIELDFLNGREKLQGQELLSLLHY